MRQEATKTLIENAAKLMSSASNLLQTFSESNSSGGNIFDVSKFIPGSDLSYSDFFSRVTIICETISKFDSSKNLLLVPIGYLSSLNSALQGTESQIQNIEANFRNEKSYGGFESFNHESFALSFKNGQSINLHSAFRSLVDNSDQVLEHFFKVLSIVRPTRSSFAFQAASTTLSEIVSTAMNEVHEAGSLRKQLEDTLKEIKASAETANTSNTEITRLLGEATAQRKTLNEYLAEATERRAKIDTVHTAASALEASVNDYKEKFDLFEEKLEERNSKFRMGAEMQNKLFERFVEKEAHVDQIVQKSEDMLKGATVAGLASSFSDAHSKLDDQLFWARISFYFGIFILFISAIPLVIYVFLPIIAPMIKAWFPELLEVSAVYDQNVTGWQYLGQVLARFVILLPAAWFVSFSAIRHSSLFRLREHYAYKYSMAVSVEGFQKQAKGYESEIAALVLEQIAFNPADKLIPSKDIRDGRIPMPLMDVLLRKFREKIEKKE